MQVFEEETSDHRHQGNTSAHRHGGVDRLEPDHLTPLPGGDIAHCRQVANGEGAAVQDLRDNQPR